MVRRLQGPEFEMLGLGRDLPLLRDKGYMRSAQTGNDKFRKTSTIFMTEPVCKEFFRMN